MTQYEFIQMWIDDLKDGADIELFKADVLKLSDAEYNLGFDEGKIEGYNINQ